MASVSRLSRLIFVDSDAHVPGNRSQARIQFPQHPFSIQGGNGQLKLTLISFQMQRSWHAVHEYNNLFYLYRPTDDAYDEFRIEPGNYATLTDFGAAVQDAITRVNAYVGSVVEVNDTKRTLLINVNNAPADAYLVCWNTRPSAGVLVPPGVSPQGHYNESYILLGGIPSRQNVPLNARNAVGPGLFAMLFKATLSTLPAIDVRLTVGGGNFSTLHERDHPAGHNLVETSVFARIPLDEASYDGPHEFVSFTDSNQTYSVTLDRKSLDFLSISVTDMQGRPLPQVDSRQQKLGLQSFRAVLRYDVLTAPLPHPYTPVLDDKCCSLPAL